MSKENNLLKDFLENSINNYEWITIEIEEIENKYISDIPHKCFSVLFVDYPNKQIDMKKEFYVLGDDIFYINENSDSIEELDEQYLWLLLLNNSLDKTCKYTKNGKGAERAGHYKTSCGELFFTIHGCVGKGSLEKFCPYCGSEILEVGDE